MRRSVQVLAAMRWSWLVVLAACSPSSKLDATLEGSQVRPGKPPDELDEKMRHCPLALDGARATLDNVEGGVRFTVRVPEASVAEVRRRAHHVVEFAAKRSREGHGEFDGKGGGHMKNCPVVTDGVAIAVTEIEGGAQLDIVAPTRGAADTLRATTLDRVAKFPFVGATISVAAR